MLWGTPAEYVPRPQEGGVSRSRSDPGLRGQADRNTSECIGQRLITRYQQKRSQEKPHTPQPGAERSVKAEGVACSQAAEGEEPPSIALAGHGAGNGHGTAQEMEVWMETTTSAIPHQIRLPFE